MSVLVVGSIAYDTIETPFEKIERTLGGSATNFCSSCSFFSKVNVVAVVGTDFSMNSLDYLVDRGADITGVYQEQGETFRWSGRYHKDFNKRDDLETHLNVFQDFKPVIPENYRKSEFVFLANIHPALQLDVLSQVENPRYVALDTIKFYIDNNPEDLKQVLKKVDVVFFNDSETRDLTGEYNLIRAAKKILEMGPESIVVKKGEHGAILVTREGIFSCPAFPLEDISDPTGAGDSFAGGFIGSLSKDGNLSGDSLRRAVVFGSVMGSFCVEKIGQERMKELTHAEINERFAQFKSITSF